MIIGPEYWAEGEHVLVVSMQYCVVLQPESESEQERLTVTGEIHQPLLPGVPESEEEVDGGVESIRTVLDLITSELPALSVEK